MNENYFVISVESRKGGVGKTTAALNLAKLLLDRNYAVLFIDADITGTNIAESLDSPFWREITSVIKEKEKPANLLEWFDQKFMCGLHLPDIFKKFNLKKINIIGSQIYDGGREKTKSRSKKKPLICSPSLLFDELHSFWFIEFLKKLSDDFTRGLNQPSVVIIDNSPGFVGIAPAIHEWLTNIGPKRGKFLTVSSLDKQDMISCCHAVDEVHQLLLNKIKAAQILKNALGNNDISLEGSENKKFFVQLVEEYQKESNSKNSSHSSLEFYFSLLDKTNGEDVIPSSYQNWIINRVPRDVKKGLLKYDAGFIFSELGSDDSELPRRIWGGRDNMWGEIPSEQLVCHDEYIEWQFLRSMFSSSDRHKYRHRRTEKIRHHFFDEIIEKARPTDTALLLDMERWFSLEQAEKIFEYIKDMQQTIETLVERLRRFDFLSLAHLIRQEWYPTYPFETVRDAFYRLMQESDYPPFEFMSFEYKTGPISEEAMHNVRMLMKYFDEQDNRPYSKMLRNSFVMVMSFLFADPLWRHPHFEEFAHFFAALMKVQSRRFEKREDRKGVRLQEFLASEEITEKGFEEMEMKMDFHFRSFPNNYFSYFYKSLCNAQARLIDLQKDTEFMIYVLRQVVMEGREELPLLPYIRPLFENVIEKKTLSHEEGKKRCAKGFTEANYMEEFHKVLTGVVRKWGIIE